MTDQLTPRVACELVGHEAIVREFYFDNAKPPVGTWGVGVTSRSGHKVERYKDNPQTIERCLEVYVWLLRNRYIPDVMDAFEGFHLTESQFAAALSFHYNTGKIEATSWVTLWRSGQHAAARQFLETHYLNGGVLTKRRKAEAALFFDGKWSKDNGFTNVIPVRKPSYTPNFSKAVRTHIMPDMVNALADG